MEQRDPPTQTAEPGPTLPAGLDAEAPTVRVCAACFERHAPGEACRPSATLGPTLLREERPAPRDEADDPLVGTVLGSFRLVRRLGRGGMGTVYLGEHVIVGTRVAVKVLRPNLAAERSFVERFVSEARAVNLIAHENIVAVYDVSVDSRSRYYLVMEYLDGLTLSRRVGRPMDPAEGVAILTQVCDALDAAHCAGIVHRDLKPDNVFLVRRAGREDFVKVVDFGIAKVNAASTGQTEVGGIVGTPEFMSPEQWGGETIDGRADIYSLGVLAYALFCGRYPFGHRGVVALFRAHLQERPVPPRQLNPSLPPLLEEVILKAMAKRPEDRFQTAAEMKDALLSVVRCLKGQPPPPPAIPRQACRAQASWSDGGPRACQALATGISKIGLFLATSEAAPPLGAQVRVELFHDAGVLACEGEVIRQVAPQQAQEWLTRPGFGVQWVAPSARVRGVLERLSRGLPAGPPVRPRAHDDPEGAALLGLLGSRGDGSAYELLGASPDADFGELKLKARQALAEIEALGHRLSQRQTEIADAMLERIHMALTVLGSPDWRAEHDASLGNYRGVARCLAAGLEVSRLEGLHEVFARRNPERAEEARARMLAGDSEAASGRFRAALAEYERGLEADPLWLELHQRYWKLSRGQGSPAGHG